ncbi:DivIVA domain-containing protein [Microbispora siamensis]|uniref:Cell wall synthesis protein Wag31 n=1 Tax=Microbispora siamensis TaxID=564413 RepID=A0ABQ4GYR3_9ACTN|nr:DivIVA domain-containing protein [Microbispora siamensis]GIH66581.1 hypothetical protein Msi02_73980 [Microbispora siamensis]
MGAGHEHGHDHGHGHDGHEHRQVNGQGHGVVILDPQSPRPGHLDPRGAAGLLTPADIRNQVFTVVRLREGYDLAEVDRFLGLVEATLISVLRDNEALRARIAGLADGPGDDSRHVPAAVGDSLARIVEAAGQAADQTLAAARREADALVAQARIRAEQLESTAAAPHDQAVSRQALESQVHSLHTFIATFGSGLKDTVDAQLERLHTLLDELCDPGGSAADRRSAGEAAPG